MTSSIRTDPEALGITAVAFDFGGVLTLPIFEELERYAAELNLPRDVFTRLLRGGPRVRELELGLLSAREYFKAMCVEVQAQYDVRIDIRRLAAAAQSAMTPEGVNPVMLHLVAEVRPGRQTALVTNNVAEATWREGFPFHLFDHVLDSCQLKLRKPDPRMYEALLDRFVRSASEVVLVDDWEENLLPAAALGIHTILFESHAQCRAELGQLGVVPAVAAASDGPDPEFLAPIGDRRPSP